jgi:HSP20 family protein
MSDYLSSALRVGRVSADLFIENMSDFLSHYLQLFELYCVLDSVAGVTNCRHTQFSEVNEEKTMTTMTRFVPFRAVASDVAVLQNRLNSIFNDFARPAGEATEALGFGSFVPAVDIYEDEQKLMLKLEVPGIRQEDLDIRVENQTLTVKGERKFEAEEKEENFHRIERHFGSFVRSFTLPQTVDTANVGAKYDAGVLSIQLAKKEAAKPKQVKIEIGSAGAAKQVEAATQ